MPTAAAIVGFWLKTFLAAVFFFPLTRVLFPSFPAGGWSLSRPIGLLLTTYPVWLAARLGGFSFGSAALGLTLLGWVMVFWVLPIIAGRRPPLPTFQALKMELVLGIFFLVLAAIRAHTPDIFGTEKFMDYAFYRSLYRGGPIPPVDPWLAGGTINYYYFGYLMAAALGRLSGLPPETAFNLIVALVPVILAGALAETVWGVTGKKIAGVITAGAVILMGNLGGVVQLLSGTARRVLDWWSPSRAIPGTITEFPYFSFLLGDLHPHYLSLLLIGTAIALWWQISRAEKGLFPLLIMAALLVGAMGPTNPWDVPIQMFLLAAVLIIFRKEGLNNFPKVLLTGAASLVLFLPFYLDFSPPSHGLGLVPAGSRTSLWQVIVTMAPFLFPILVVGGRKLINDLNKMIPGLPEAAWGIAAAGLIVPWLALRSWGAAVIVFCVVVCLVRVLKDRDSFPYLLAGAGALCLLVPELVFFRDAYGADMFRMNTVFKFYYQGWVLAGAGAVMIVFREWRWWPATWKIVTWGLLLAMGLVYTLGATWSKTLGFSGPATLDGMAFMEQVHPDDRAAIGFLNRAYPNRVVIVEASKDSYAYFSRVSTFTGQQTLLGWGNHESLWREDYALTAERLREVEMIYTSPDHLMVEGILKSRGVDLIYFGALERETYGTANLDWMKATFPVVYEGGEVTIFRAD